jgi:hypothetical protein
MGTPLAVEDQTRLYRLLDEMLPIADHLQVKELKKSTKTESTRQGIPSDLADQERLQRFMAETLPIINRLEADVEEIRKNTKTDRISGTPESNSKSTREGWSIAKGVAEWALIFDLLRKPMGTLLKRWEKEGFAQNINRQSWQVDLSKIPSKKKAESSERRKRKLESR